MMLVSAILRALGTPRRREILRLVWDRERSVGEIHGAFDDDVSFGTISEHLQVLEQAGLVAARRAGRFRYFRARREELGALESWLSAMWASSLDRLALLAELEAARRGPRARRRRRRTKRTQGSKGKARR